MLFWKQTPLSSYIEKTAITSSPNLTLIIFTLFHKFSPPTTFLFYSLEKLSQSLFVFVFISISFYTCFFIFWNISSKFSSQPPFKPFKNLFSLNIFVIKYNLINFFLLFPLVVFLFWHHTSIFWVSLNIQMFQDTL